MQAYGVKRQDHGCCPGCDKHPTSSYSNRRSAKARARDRQATHGKARQAAKKELRSLVEE